MRALGLIRRSEETRAKLAAERPYVPLHGTVLSSAIQPVAWLRNQLGKPSCVGQAIAGRRDSLVEGNVWMSAVDLWTDARRRDGTLLDWTAGTYAESAFESLIHRGTSRYKPGEDARPTEQDTQIDDLAGELEAADARLPESWEHHQVTGSVASQVVDALDRGLVVVFGDGLRAPFFDIGVDEVATSKHFGGDSSGHEQGVVGYHAGRALFIGQGSWGTSFAGITLPDDVTDNEIRAKFPCAKGRFLPGCFWLEPEVLEQCWSVDVLRVA